MKEFELSIAWPNGHIAKYYGLVIINIDDIDNLIQSMTGGEDEYFEYRWFFVLTNDTVYL